MSSLSHSSSESTAPAIFPSLHATSKRAQSKRAPLFTRVVVYLLSLFTELIARDVIGGRGTLNVTVILEDVNDHVPEFDPTSYTFDVSEDTPVGTTVLEVTATDGDRGDMGLNRYGLSADSELSRYFGVNTITRDGQLVGVVYVKEPPDREELGDRVTFQVYAIDNDGLYSEANVVGTIQDVNDQAPFFEKDFYNMEVYTDSPVGFSVGNIMAVDFDIGK